MGNAASAASIGAVGAESIPGSPITCILCALPGLASQGVINECYLRSSLQLIANRISCKIDVHASIRSTSHGKGGARLYIEIGQVQSEHPKMGTMLSHSGGCDDIKAGSIASEHLEADR